jgi:hypothetical protein
MNCSNTSPRESRTPAAKKHLELSSNHRLSAKVPYIIHQTSDIIHHRHSSGYAVVFLVTSEQLNPPCSNYNRSHERHRGNPGRLHRRLSTRTSDYSSCSLIHSACRVCRSYQLAGRRYIAWNDTSGRIQGGRREEMEHQKFARPNCGGCTVGCLCSCSCSAVNCNN